LVQYARDHGGPGKVYVAPMDVYFAQSNVVEPDVLYLTGETAATLVDPRYVDVPPDLVVEVSSPGTRITDLTRKKELYARFGVREYWFVDLESDRIDVYRLEDGRYDRPSAFVRSDTLTSPVLPGLSLSVDEILGPRED
jgi:Uma2 family endonuclease